MLHLVSLSSLIITLVLASSITMFWSPDMAVYEANREIFYRYGFICTLVYFICALWALHPEEKPYLLSNSKNRESVMKEFIQLKQKNLDILAGKIVFAHPMTGRKSRRASCISA